MYSERNPLQLRCGELQRVAFDLDIPEGFWKYTGRHDPLGGANYGL